MTEPWTIRPCDPTEAFDLAVLAERTFREAYEGLDLDEYCASAFAEEIQLREILDPSFTTVVADSGGELIGYAQLADGEVPDCIPEPSTAIELRRIYVDRARYGTGLGRALLEAVRNAASDQGRESLWLGVWEGNPRAIRFYEKAGFSVAGEQTFELGAKIQRDVIMVARLSP